MGLHIIHQYLIRGLLLSFLRPGDINYSIEFLIAKLFIYLLDKTKFFSLYFKILFQIKTSQV